jgi:hypothetical protein
MAIAARILTSNSFRSWLAAVMIGAVWGVFGLALPVPARAAYFGAPASPPAVTCTKTAMTLGELQTNVSSAKKGSTQCLANGTYAGTLALSTSASTPVKVASVSSYGAIVQGGVVVNSRNVTVHGFDVQNTTASGSGDCVVIAAGLGGSRTSSGVSVQYSRVHNCNRNGARLTRPACSPTPCTPSTGYSYGVKFHQDWFYDVGNTDNSGSHLILRGPNAALTNFDITDGPNDAILAWNDGVVVSNGNIHDMTAAVPANHNDALQSWNNATADGAQGQPLTNFTFERVRVWNMNGPDAHGIITRGAAQFNWKVYSNEFRNIGGQPISLGSTAEPGNITAVNVVGNTFVCAAASPNTIEYVNASSGKAENNIFLGCNGWGSDPIWVGTGSVVEDFNLSWGGEQVTGAHSKPSTDPLFVNAAASDYHVTSLSPAKDAGDDSAVIAGWLDIDGAARLTGPHTDMGADEQ